MAKYNTFVLVDTKVRKTLLVTSSARKARRELEAGKRIEVWSDNQKTQTVYSTQANKLNPYIEAEREYIRMKQVRAEVNNATRKVLRT